MSNKSLARRTNGVLASKSASGAVGKTMVVAGGGGLALLGVAALLPFVTFLWLCVGLVVAGVFLAE